MLKFPTADGVSDALEGFAILLDERLDIGLAKDSDANAILVELHSDLPNTEKP